MTGQIARLSANSTLVATSGLSRFWQRPVRSLTGASADLIGKRVSGYAALFNKVSFPLMHLSPGPAGLYTRMDESA